MMHFERGDWLVRWEIGWCYASGFQPSAIAFIAPSSPQ
jgi:hypothetical protein